MFLFVLFLLLLFWEFWTSNHYRVIQQSDFKFAQTPLRKATCGNIAPSSIVALSHQGHTAFQTYPFLLRKIAIWIHRHHGPISPQEWKASSTEVDVGRWNHNQEEAESEGGVSTLKGQPSGSWPELMCSGHYPDGSRIKVLEPSRSKIQEPSYQEGEDSIRISWKMVLNYWTPFWKTKACATRIRQGHLHPIFLCLIHCSRESGTHGVGGDGEVGGKRDPRRASVAMFSSLLLFLRAVKSHQHVEWPWIPSHKLSCEEIRYFYSLQYANLTILSPFHQMANHEFLSIH